MTEEELTQETSLLYTELDSFLEDFRSKTDLLNYMIVHMPHEFVKQLADAHKKLGGKFAGPDIAKVLLAVPLMAYSYIYERRFKNDADAERERVKRIMGVAGAAFALAKMERDNEDIKNGMERLLKSVGIKMPPENLEEGK